MKHKGHIILLIRLSKSVMLTDVLRIKEKYSKALPFSSVHLVPLLLSMTVSEYYVS